jgi:1,4-alpha-glucan branching enzyme
MPGDEWRRFAGLRTLFAYMWAHPGKQLLFMGSEFGQGSEWSEKNGLDWWVLQFDYHSGARRLVRDLNALYQSSPALWSSDSDPSGFAWIDANDAQGNVLSFLRFGSQEHGVPVLACVVNFSAVPRHDYRVGLPLAGQWREILNTDATAYGGSGVGNSGSVTATPKPWHGRPASATLTVPPMGAIWLTHDLWSPDGTNRHFIGHP